MHTLGTEIKVQHCCYASKDGKIYHIYINLKYISSTVFRIFFSVAVKH